MKLQSHILTGSDAFKSNRAAHLAALETVRQAAEAAARASSTSRGPRARARRARARWLPRSGSLSDDATT